MQTEKMDGILGRSMIAGARTNIIFRLNSRRIYYYYYFFIFRFVPGVNIIELVVSLFCISNFLCIVQHFFPVIIVYVWFENPIQVTNGLIAFAILIIIVGWTGFFYGMYETPLISDIMLFTYIL